MLFALCVCFVSCVRCVVLPYFKPFQGPALFLARLPVSSCCCCRVRASILSFALSRSFFCPDTFPCSHFFCPSAQKNQNARKGKRKRKNKQTEKKKKKNKSETKNNSKKKKKNVLVRPRAAHLDAARPLLSTAFFVFRCDIPAWCQVCRKLAS